MTDSIGNYRKNERKVKSEKRKLVKISGQMKELIFQNIHSEKGNRYPNEADRSYSKIQSILLTLCLPPRM